MQNSENTLIARRIGLIPREPVIDFGTVEIGDTVSPQSFTVELTPDTQGTIMTDVDWISVEPTTFMKGQTEITVRLLNEKLQRGQQLQEKITVSITTPVHEQRPPIPVRVKVRRFSDEDFARLFDRQAQMETAMAEMERQLQSLPNRLKAEFQAIGTLFDRQAQLEKVLALQKNLMEEQMAAIKAHLRQLDNEVQQATPQPRLQWQLSTERIRLGETFELLVTMTNQGGVDADHGGITVSFPSVTRLGEEAEITSESDIDESNRWIGINERGGTVWGGDVYEVMPNRPIVADYLMIEEWHRPWPWRKEHFLKLSVRPKQLGEFPIYVTGWLVLGEFHASFKTPKANESKNIDQQIHPVYALKVDVMH